MAYTKEIQYFNCFILKGDSGYDNYHVEESRIKGGYNEPFVDYGVRAHITDETYARQERPNAMTYSGIFNNKTGVNNTNEFSIGENITKSVDIQQGSIQKLFAEDTNLNIFQEERVSRALIDKDAIYSAEGSPITTSTANVIGQVISYGGNYGIGKNPESFAYYAGRKYFVDKPKGAILRLSRDGITEISNYGMRSYFRDLLSGSDKVYGMWDMYNKDYVVSIQGPGITDTTVAFDENVNGWTSRYSYIPQMGGSLDAKFYTFNNCDVYEHYTGVDYNSFYGTSYNSEVTIIFNQNPSVNKSFVTLNYEGTSNWSVENISTDTDTAQNVATYNPVNDDLIISAFQKMDNKYFTNIFNATTSNTDEVVFGGDISGIKGFYAKITAKTSNTNYNELFALSTNYNINTY
jgi:hypothetical protein